MTLKNQKQLFSTTSTVSSLEVIKDLFLVEWYANSPAELDQHFTAVMQESQLPAATAFARYLVSIDFTAGEYVPPQQVGQQHH